MSEAFRAWRASGIEAPAVDEDIAAALRTVIDPCSAATGAPLNLLDMGLIAGVDRIGGEVQVALRLTAPICWNAAPMMEAVEQAVGRIPGVVGVVCRADHTLEWTPAHMSAQGKRRLELIRPVRNRIADE